MLFKHLSINDFRNIVSAEIEFHPKLNILYGANGSGKTSVLEALSLLSTGRSFRSNLTSPIIRHGCKSTTIFSSLQDGKGSLHKLGVSKHKSVGTRIKLDSESVSSASTLARLIPLQVIDGTSFSVVDGGPKCRRSVLDWLVFHVEPDFLQATKGVANALKQRNALLRRGIISDGQLAIWTDKLAQQGEQVNQLRGKVFSVIKDHFEVLYKSTSSPVIIDFTPGWLGESLEDCLQSLLSKDIEQGSTKAGPHRADLLFSTDEKRLSDIFSRGQKKSFVLYFYLAVIKAFASKLKTPVTICLDDLTAELDRVVLERVIQEYLAIPGQIFLTVIEPDVVLSLLPKDSDYHLFHVEHGKIQQINNC